MRPTITLLENEARKAILKGVNTVYNAVKLTLGPEGANALAYRTFGRGPRIFDDGHATAQIIEPKNEAEKLAATAFKEATSQTNQKAGDGTATTTVIGGVLINNILGNVSNAIFSTTTKIGVKKISRELLTLSKQVQEKVKERAKKVESLEELEKIAFISMGNQEISKTIAKVVWEVGLDGFIDVVEGYKGELETEVIKGARFAAKPAGKGFINNPKRFEMVIEDCAVLLTNYKIDNIRQADVLFSRILKNNKKIAVLAPDFSDNILQGMHQIMYKPVEGGFMKTGLDVWPVKVPSLRTEQFEDLAIYFGANFIDKNTGKKLENIEDTDLGFVTKLVVKDSENRDDAVALGGRGSVEQQMKVENKEYKVTSPVSERIKVLKSQIAEERDDIRKKLLERRIASLASAVGVIRVGASTTAESIPLKLKIEDAQYACKSALEEGYVKGGGLCLKEIAEELPESILTPALKAPYEQIQENNEEKLEIGDDVIDPAKVVRLAVEHAVSVAAHLITVKVLVAEEEEKSPIEGYMEIAKALRVHNALWARRENVKIENMEEIEKDHMRIVEQQEGRD